MPAGRPEPAAPAERRHLRVVPPPRRDPDPLAAPVPRAPRRSAAPGPHRADQGQLPLLHLLPGGSPAAPRPHRGLRLVETPESDVDGDPLPDPRRWAARLIQATVESRWGDRPLAQLVPWTTRAVYDELVREQAGLIRERDRRPTARRVRAVRPVIRSLHLCQPADGVVEACSVVHDGTRARAVALRLEAKDGRWICTALELR